MSFSRAPRIGQICSHNPTATTATATTTTTTTTTATTATGWPSGINGRLNNMFLDPEDPGSIPGEEHGKI